MSTVAFRSKTGRATAALILACVMLVAGCPGSDKPAGPKPEAKQAEGKSPAPVPTEPPPRELLEPVDLWRNGARAGQVDAQGPDAGDYVFLDLGEGWTPVLFTDGTGADGKELPHHFRATYLALARGEFPDDPYGERARDDKYLELYGIMPTLDVLRKRLHWATSLACSKQLDLTALNDFTGVIAYENPLQALKTRTQYLVARKHVERIMGEQGVAEPALIDLAPLKDKDQAQVKYYLSYHDDFEAIKAAQDRLLCEGYFKGKGKWTKGAFDWPTHEALAEFERRHRVHSWGAMGPATMEALRMETAAVEHETVIRVLTERAMHAFGAIEDGSATKPDGTPVTFKGADGQLHAVPDLEKELRNSVIEGFGLKDPQTTLAFLDSLGKLEQDGHRYVAIPGPRRPEYYAANMELSVSIDRGDVWYEFPFDEQGKERPQPVSRRPRTTIFVSYLDQKVAIARFGTTIGGWRSELVENSVMWKYKGSPHGEVLWQEVVSAPVWLPPNTTPPRELLKRRKERKEGESKWEPNYHETGPSYASAYGLVAAYHREYVKRPDGTLRITKDDGIRSHGSVDYMSIMRRHSHGCHRLHNHIAVRLFSFVINHRPHVRKGHPPMAFLMNLEYEEEQHAINIKRGGYEFELTPPIFVTVEEGRIRGNVKQPILTAIPKYHDECKGYYLPDGTAVAPKPNGALIPVNAPPCEPILRALPPPTVQADAGVPPVPPVAEGEVAPAASASASGEGVLPTSIAPN